MPDSIRALLAGVGMLVAAGVGVAMPLLFVLYRPHEVRQERASKELCLHCGYDLTGNVSGVCPECGRAK